MHGGLVVSLFFGGFSKLLMSTTGRVLPESSVGLGQTDERTLSLSNCFRIKWDFYFSLLNVSLTANFTRETKCKINSAGTLLNFVCL